MVKPQESFPSYSIVWSEDDGEWAASCSIYPSVSWMEATPSAALTGLMALLDGFAASQG